MKLTENIISSFKVAKVFKENVQRINCLNFSPNGETIISSSDDDSILIYDCKVGTVKRILHSKKYGVDHITSTHHQNAALHSSTKVDDTIRYLSLHDNKYIRYFQGHTKKVICLSISPIDDTFLSGSLDKTLRLWDLRSPYSQGFMTLPGKPVASFDPEGLIFAVGTNSETIKLYDLRSFDKGPFITFMLQQEVDSDWTNIKFSPDGRYILISTSGTNIRLIDAFKGTPLKTLTGYTNAKGLNIEASFSPDAAFILSGSTDGVLHIWNRESGEKVAALNGEHTNPIQCVQFNPKFMMIASACLSMNFWIPTKDE